MDTESAIAAADRQQLQEIREAAGGEIIAVDTPFRRATADEIATARAYTAARTADWDNKPADESARHEIYLEALEVLVFANGGRQGQPAEDKPAARTEAEILAALDARLAALEADSTEPDDTEMIGIDLDDAGPYAAVWVRQDQTEETGYAPEKRWWKVGGDPGDTENGPLTYREVIGYEAELPAGERRNVTVGRVYTIPEIREMLPALLSQN